MIEIKSERPPRTANEVWNILPEGTLAEVIENQLYMAPPPNEKHQATSMDLTLEVAHFIRSRKLGITRAAPYGVHLYADNVVEPDLVIVLNDNLQIIKDDGIHGTPDMIIEILSPSNRDYDLKKKRLIYEKFEVKEYWIVEPQTKESVGFELVEGKYHEFSRDKNKLSSKLLEHQFKF